MPSAPTQATQATKIKALPIKPMSEHTKPAVRIPPVKPCFLAFEEQIKPIIPVMSPIRAPAPKNQNITDTIPRTKEAIAAPFPG